MDDTLQEIIMVGELVFRVSKALTIAAVKTIVNLYYSQTSGDTASFRKFFKIAGNNSTYIEVATQDLKVLADVKHKVLDNFNILYCELPDLNYSDGKTQLVIDGRQIEAFKAGINKYNAEKLDKLKELKKLYGPNSEEYLKAKEELDKAMPSIVNISADDYALTRLDQFGNETPEYKEFEASAKEELKKIEAEKAKELSESSEEYSPMTTSLKEEKIVSAVQKAKNEDLLLSGKAETLELEDIKIEYIDMGGKTPVYRGIINNEKSILLGKDEVLSPQTALIKKDKAYRIIDAKSPTVLRLDGKELLGKIKNVENAVANIARTTEKIVTVGGRTR